MAAAGNRDVERSPRAVRRQLLVSDGPAEGTMLGQPTAAALVPPAPGPHPWVRGAELAAITPLTPDAAQRLHEDLDAVDQGTAPPS